MKGTSVRENLTSEAGDDVPKKRQVEGLFLMRVEPRLRSSLEGNLDPPCPGLDLRRAGILPVDSVRGQNYLRTPEFRPDSPMAG